MNQTQGLTNQILDEVLDNLPGLVFRTINDGQWTFVYASRGSEALLGYAPEELVNAKKLRKMIPKEDQKLNKQVLSNLTPTQPHYQVVYRIRPASGPIKWVKEEGTGVFSEKGQLLALDAFLMDITEQKLTEERLRQENIRLRTSFSDRHRLDNLIGKSLAMQELFDVILKSANTRGAVVISGESGTGKELAARAIHTFSDRSEKPFITVNSGAIPENLLESEFFGYRKGAFSGALTDRQGLLEAAHGGTLFLDEIGEIPLNLQIKLLRALEGGGHRRVGDTRVRFADFRLIAATHQELEDLVRAGRMREDFYYRINAIRLRMPPLRERKDDILLLADYFLEKYSDASPVPLPSTVQAKLLQYSWPGNVRELQNVLSRYITLGSLELTGEVLSKGKDPEPAKPKPRNRATSLVTDIQDLEKHKILEALVRNKWHIGKSAAELGFSRRTMQRRMQQYNLKR